MVYVSPENVRAVLAKSEDDYEGTAASLSDSKISEAIASAEAEVNARLSNRYRVPFVAETVPKLVSDITRDIAAYLADLVYRGEVDHSSENEPVLLRHRRAEALLKGLADGDITAPTYDLPGVGQADRPKVLNAYTGRLFGNEQLARPQYGDYRTQAQRFQNESGYW